MARQIFGYRDAQNVCRVRIIGERWCWHLCDPGQPRGEEQYEWGYGGAGPRGLARAILFAVTADEEVASLLCQRFKWEVIAKLDRAFWVIDYEDVERWLIHEAYRLNIEAAVDAGTIELGEGNHVATPD